MRHSACSARKGGAIVRVEQKTKAVLRDLAVRTLDVPLVWLERFPWLHLFPVQFGNKAQPLLKDYLNRASNDPAQIRRWHTYWKTRFDGVECWWGVAPALSRLVFADIDTKPGKRGQHIR
jgi:hypothetical protein